MAFELNDYNAFLRSLSGDRQKEQQQKVKNPPPNMEYSANTEGMPLQMIESNETMSPNNYDERFPIDFDFGLNQNIGNNMILDDNLNDNEDTYTTNSKNMNSSISGTRNISRLSTNDSSVFERDLFSPNNPYPERNTTIKHESSDDDVLSPDLELPDSFYQHFDNINQIPKPAQKPQRARSTGRDIKKERRESKDTIIDRPGRGRMPSAHNVIEQRYRNKINDKFTALLESVPTLRIVSKRKKQPEEDSYLSEESEEEGNLEGLEPARKLNKGVILSKSIEYIKFLELKNDRMKQQNSELMEKARMLGISLDQL